MARDVHLKKLCQLEYGNVDVEQDVWYIKTFLKEMKED